MDKTDTELNDMYFDYLVTKRRAIVDFEMH